MQLEYGNECRFAPSHSIIVKQAITTKQPTSIQTVTMQPMWCNPNINTCLSNTTGLDEGWDKSIHTNLVTHTSLYTEKSLHRGTFTHRQFYTWILLHRETFVHPACTIPAKGHVSMDMAGLPLPPKERI